MVVFLILSKIFHDFLKDKDYGEPDSTGERSLHWSLHLPVFSQYSTVSVHDFSNGGRDEGEKDNWLMLYQD